MTLETDYLIVGSGAVGMAFADVLLAETDATIIIVDKYAKPGGHWNWAYPFVTLHQPSQFYGVSSKELSKGRVDEVGLNKGLYELASGAEVSAYFDEVMKGTFLPSGRVQYFPLCEYKGDYKFVSLITGEKHEVKVKKKLVDATYLKTTVPSTHTPNFTIEEGVQFMPLNDLPTITTPPEGFVVIGGGKTGIDACIWLLENKVDPDKITWIVSRDAWLLDRQNTQPTSAFFENSIGTMANQFEAIAQATSVEDLFAKLEEKGVLVRIYQDTWPSMFHGATISQMELQELRKIKNVIRMGRVQRLEKDQIVLDQGVISTNAQVIHVDCSASAISNLETKPVFQGDVITPQTVRSYQPVFSAAVIAYVEATYATEAEKNKLCQVVPLPNHNTDWLKMTAAMMQNQFTWSQDKTLGKWILNNRLDGFGQVVKNVDRSNEKNVAILNKFKNNALPAMMNLQKLMKSIEPQQTIKLEKPQFQVRKKAFFEGRIKASPAKDLSLGEGDILVKVEKFAYTANNITYAVAGDMIGYWNFFPPAEDPTQEWGIIPVWGFAEVVESNLEEIPVGDRLYGYFPPATHLKLHPTKVSQKRFIDGSPHRLKLPIGYNIYQRVLFEPGYSPEFDQERMLLFPLHLTSFCIWDALQDKDWYGAEQVIILSASSKTSIGLGYAFQADEKAPPTVGVTSASNLETVQSLGLYDQCLTYDQVATIKQIPTVIVDMSGNSNILLTLHQYLGNDMKFTSNVGLTHWDNASAKPKEGIITDRSEFFFAPGHIQKRMKEWGPTVFDQKTTEFLKTTAAKTKQWLKFKKIEGLAGLMEVHPAVCSGKIPANEGLIVEM